MTASMYAMKRRRKGLGFGADHNAWFGMPGMWDLEGKGREMR